MMEGFRARAASLLSGTSGSIRWGGEHREAREPFPDLPEEANELGNSSSRNRSNASSQLSRIPESGQEAKFDAPRLPVRTLPAWVQSRDEDDIEENVNVETSLLPKPPPEAQVAQHNVTPYARSSDRLRSYEISGTPKDETNLNGDEDTSGNTSRWRVFIDDYEREAGQPSRTQRVSEAWLGGSGPDYLDPTPGAEDIEKSNSQRSHESRKSLWARTQRVILRNAIIPLVLRLVVLIFSFFALAIGGRLYARIRSSNGIDQVDAASPLMAIVVDAVAPVYLFWITHDEYTGRPLGLRSAKAKTRLVLCDLFFIVFDSANLSLAFASTRCGSYSCSHNPASTGDESLQQALASVLLVALIAWLMTFTISVFRLVERVQG